MKPFSRALEFAGKSISVIHADNEWWVAVKPICDALTVDYEAQRKRIKSDPILSRVSSNQTVHDASNRRQEMVCILEKYVYGWVFSLQSNSSELEEYKLQCYDILFNHFHSALTGRINTLQERLDVDQKIIDLQAKMLESDEQRQIVELRKSKNMLTKRLRELDKELVEGQISMALS